MGSRPNRPAPFIDFAARFPELGQMWGLSAKPEENGPLDERTTCFVRLAGAIGAMREAAVNASVQKAQDLGIESEDLEQVVALATGALGMPDAAAARGWVRDLLPEE